MTFPPMPGSPDQPSPEYAPHGAVQNRVPVYGPPLYVMPSGRPGPWEPFDGAPDPRELSRPLYGASFGRAIQRFFRQYARFSGRASRSEYWWVQLFGFLVTFVTAALTVVGAIIGAKWANDHTVGAPALDGLPPGMADYPPAALMFFGGLILTFVMMVAMILPSLSLSWRRMHDADFSGALWLLNLIPYVGGLVFFILSLMPPKPMGRRFDR